MINLTRKRFLAWLRTQKGYVGDPESTEDCPLCRYFKDHGARDVEVYYDNRKVDGHWEDNRAWTKEFQLRAVKIAELAEVQEIDSGTAHLIALHV